MQLINQLINYVNYVQIQSIPSFRLVVMSSNCEFCDGPGNDWTILCCFGGTGGVCSCGGVGGGGGGLIIGCGGGSGGGLQTGGIGSL